MTDEALIQLGYDLRRAWHGDRDDPWSLLGSTGYSTGYGATSRPHPLTDASDRHAPGRIGLCPVMRRRAKRAEADAYARGVQRASIDEARARRKGAA